VISTNWKSTVIDHANPLVVGDDISNHYPADIGDGEEIEFQRWYGVLESSPAAASPAVAGFTFEIEKSSNNGASWSLAFSGTFLSSEKVKSGDTFTISTILSGDRLRYNVSLSDGTAAVFTLVIVGTRRLAS